MSSRVLKKALLTGLASLLLFLLSVTAGYTEWKVVSPLPTVNQLRAVWAHSENDVFAVGDYGVVLHYDGTAWEAIAVGINNIYGIWGTSGDDVFAVGDKGLILRYDGTKWQNMSSGTSLRLRDVWGTSNTDVFAVGENGTTLHYDGNVWNRMTNATILTLQGVWGTSGSDVYAVGGASASTGPGSEIIVYYDGSTWQQIYSGNLERLHDLWGSPETDIFTVGELGGIFNYDGVNWSSVANPVNGNTSITLRDIWGSAGDDIFAVGDAGTVLHYNGTKWSLMTTNTSAKLHGVGGSSATDVFAVGEGGMILHYDGKDDGDNGDCPFTAVLGKGNPQLKTLRQVRDEVLVKSETGQMVIAFYYANGGLLARGLEKQPVVRQVAKNILELLLPAIKNSIEYLILD